MTTIMDQFKMDGYAAIVTGGVGLLGTEFCRTLAEAGADAYIVKGAFDQDELLRAVARLT